MTKVRKQALDSPRFKSARQQFYEQVSNAMNDVATESGLSRLYISKEMGLAADTTLNRIMRAGGGNTQLSTIADFATAMGLRPVLMFVDDEAAAEG